jgi:glutathione S-transferase
MTHTKPRLVTFGISHFCEKARWALDWHGINYEEISWPPGVHQILAKRFGAKGTTLPILLDDETVVQGSGAIIDWADQETRDPTRKLTVADALDIEQRIDESLVFTFVAWDMPKSFQGFPTWLSPQSSAMHQALTVLLAK